jgi:hypothetical protein
MINKGFKVLEAALEPARPDGHRIYKTEEEN